MKTFAAKNDSRVDDAEKFLLPTYKRQPFVLERGKGCYVYDAAGKKYLDFLGGIAVNALGHAHPRIVKVIRREAARAIHFSNLYHNAYQGPLARKLAEWSGLDRVFFCNSGTEAIDGAMKLARLCARTPQDVTGQPARKHRFLALENSFHGRTYGAISVTATEKYRLPFAPVVPGVEFVRFNDVADLESKFDYSVCGILIETVQGEGGIYPVSESFWNRARALATEHGALMIADEIQCGLGRTGRYFAYQRFSSKPDIAVIAKPLAAGLPLGAILATNKVASYISPGLHGTTFGGGPLVCAAALECLQIIEDEKLLENVRSRGEELKTGLQALAAKFDFIREVRAEGLMLGVHLSVEGAPFVAEAAKRGLLINCTHDYTLRLLPPFIMTRTQVREFLKLFSAVLAAVSEKPASAEVSTPVTSKNTLPQGETMTATMLAVPALFTHDLLTGAEWNPPQTRELLHLASEIKAHPGGYASTLRGKFIALIFEKPSLRTRVTFEVGIQSMGGSVIFLDHTQARLGERECISDVARNLERWVHGIVARVYEQRVLEEMAAVTDIPVINALSDKYHPCQALADFMTIEEKVGSLRGFKLAYVGDGNNVCNSLIFLAARLGVHLRIATPAGYEPAREVIQEAKRVARETRAKVELFTDPREAVDGAQGVYTDAWTSMGFEAEGNVRENVFRAYQVNAELMSLAAPDALFLHCLPAHRNHEVTPEVLDGPQSVVLDQSENRMYVQKAILHTLFS